MITDNQLRELIQAKFNILGRAACKNRDSFIFYMQSIYGDSLDVEKTRIFYDQIRENYRKEHNE